MIKMKEKFLGIDIGGTNIKYGLVNSNGKLLNSGIVNTPQTQEALVKTLRDIIATSGDVLGVGISMPGVISNNVIKSTGALAFIDVTTIQNEISKYTKLPITYINDANAAGLAELWKGKGKDYENFICITLGTAVGGVLIIDGKVYEGYNGLAGEFGASLSIDHEESIADCVSAHCGTVVGCCRRYGNLSGVKTRDMKAIIKAYHQKEEHALKAVNDFIKANGTLAFNLSVTLGPQAIFFGGGVSQDKHIMMSIKDYYELLANKYSPLSKTLMATIEVCTYEQNSGVIGAAYHAMRKESYV